MVGAQAVIGDVVKQRSTNSGRYLNRDRIVIPLPILEKPPSAELRPGQKDTDSLPPYEVLGVMLDPILQAYVERYETPEQIAAEHHFDLATGLSGSGSWWSAANTNASRRRRCSRSPASLLAWAAAFPSPSSSGISKMREELNAASYKPSLFVLAVSGAACALAQNPAPQTPRLHAGRSAERCFTVATAPPAQATRFPQSTRQTLPRPRHQADGGRLLHAFWGYDAARLCRFRLSCRHLRKA